MADTQFISDDNQPIPIRTAMVETTKPSADHNTDAEAAFPAAHVLVPQMSPGTSTEDTQGVTRILITLPQGQEVPHDAPPRRSAHKKTITSYQPYKKGRAAVKQKNQA